MSQSIKRDRLGYRLFKPARYEPAARVVPPDASVDFFDLDQPGRERFARWGNGQKIRVVRATKGQHAGQDLAVLETATYYVEFRDHLEKIRRLPLFTSRKGSEETPEKLVQIVADVQTTGRLSHPDLVRWVGGLPERIRLKLVEIGLLERERAGAAKSLVEHLEDFHAMLLAKGVTAKQARLVKTRVEALVNWCKFRRICDITAGRVTAALAELRTGTDDRAPISQRTSNFYLGAMNQFCRWLLKDRRASENPLVGTEKVKITDDEKRRALTVEEQRWLLNITGNQPDRFGMSGDERSMAYRVALGTGFRVSELASLRRGDFNLDSDPPTITLAASASKNRKAVEQPITPELAEHLRNFLRLKAPDAVAFNLPPSHKTAEMIRLDMEAGRSAWLADANPAQREEREKSGFLLPETDEGKADFHSLRHTFITSLAMGGVHPKDAQILARHSTITLTMDRYTHTHRGRLVSALGALPDLSQPLPQTPRKTGTDDAAAPSGAQRELEKRLALCLAQTGGSGRTSLDSTGLEGRNPQAAQPVADTRETPDSREFSRTRRRARVAEGGGLENRCARKGTGGSNPSASVTHTVAPRRGTSRQAVANM